MNGTGSRLRRSPLPSFRLSDALGFLLRKQEQKTVPARWAVPARRALFDIVKRRQLFPSGSWHQVLTQHQDGGCFRTPSPPRLTITFSKHTRHARGSILRVTGTRHALSTINHTRQIEIAPRSFPADLAIQELSVRTRIYFGARASKVFRDQP